MSGKSKSVKWIRKHSQSWLCSQIDGASITPEPTIHSPQIEQLAEETNRLGPQPLWEGYRATNAAGRTRMPNVVRTSQVMGNFYTFLVQRLRPDIVVEFGTAFGVSGMYFLAGIELNSKGTLLTFEPNSAWRELAIGNLSRISEKFTSIAGTFEQNIDAALPRTRGIDLAFIDAIHTREFVIPQLDIVVSRCSDRAIIILDDINFSDSMRQCWKEVSRDDRFAASVELGTRVGIVELDRTRG